jgi:hypothetical protein
LNGIQEVGGSTPPGSTNQSMKQSGDLVVPAAGKLQAAVHSWHDSTPRKVVRKLPDPFCVLMRIA